MGNKMNRQQGVPMRTPSYIFIIILVASVIASVLLAVSIGSTSISVSDVYKVIAYELSGSETFAEYAKGAVHDIVWLVRLPRIVLAVAAGMGLAVCGAIMQAVVKNPLADPYILGISSGASLGATLAILLGIGAAFGTASVGIMAFLGAFSISMLVVLCANVGGRANAIKLLLAGMALSAICSAFSSLIVYLSNNKQGIQNIAYWLMGSLAGAKWDSLAFIFPIVLLCTLFFCTQYRTLNLMLLGDEVSITLGTNLHVYRHVFLIMSSLMVGFIVYSSGMIGFVGLLIPHVVRMLFGTDHRRLIPISALIGSVFLIWADVLCRIILPNSELPIGILTSIIGAPWFVYLMMKKKYGFGV